MRSRSFSRTALSFAAAAIVIMAFSSCGSDLLQVSGSWSQTSVDNKMLPDTVPNSSPVIVITSGEAEITDGGHYTFTFNGTSDGVQGVVGTDEGTLRLSHSTFLFKSSTTASFIAALTGNTFQVELPGQFVHSSNASVNMVFVQAP
jgi:hypothetical protein